MFIKDIFNKKKETKLVGNPVLNNTPFSYIKSQKGIKNISEAAKSDNTFNNANNLRQFENQNNSKNINNNFNNNKHF